MSEQNTFDDAIYALSLSLFEKLPEHQRNLLILVTQHPNISNQEVALRIGRTPDYVKQFKYRYKEIINSAKEKLTIIRGS